MLIEGRYFKIFFELWVLILVLGVEGGDFKCKKKRVVFWGNNGNLFLKLLYFDFLLYCY